MSYSHGNVVFASLTGLIKVAFMIFAKCGKTVSSNLVADQFPTFFNPAI